MFAMNTLSSAIEWFLGHCANHRKLSAHTLKAYRHDLKLFDAFLSNASMESNVVLPAIDKNTVQRWLGGMNGVKPRTVRRRLATVKAMFSCLERQECIANDPLGRFRSEIKVGSSLPRVIARSTVRSLLRSPRKQANSSPVAQVRLMQESALLETLFSTGMRVSETSSLTIGQVDLERQTISVHGKGNREREIPIVCGGFQEALLRQIAWRRANGGMADSPLFVSRRGTRLSDESIRAILRRHAGLIGARRVPASYANPLRAQTVHLALTLLFSCGLRRGELLRLRLRHFDSSEKVLHMEQTKFHKSRLVPLSHSVGRLLDRYLALRRRRCLPLHPDSPLIWSHGRPASADGYCAEALTGNWHQLGLAAGVLDDKGRPPHLHDLRHSFAVAALHRWYRQGANVQAKFSHLATYLDTCAPCPLIIICI